MRNRHRSTLARIFASPTPPDIRWAEVVSLLRALDVEILEAAGSRVRLRSGGKQKVIHRPHPKPYLSKGAVRDVVDFLNEVGVSP
ncbi:MAG: type II toxin-antitoxin system HicA family toxin [Chloroflexi bacterium]|nr:type II toxin-antitoxin system HicA family toxin [Chloroflexota bacterium]